MWSEWRRKRKRGWKRYCWRWGWSGEEMHPMERRRNSRSKQPNCEATPSFRSHSCFICVISFSLEVDRLVQLRHSSTGWSSKQEKSIYFYGLLLLRGRRQNFKRDRRKNNRDIKTFPVFSPARRTKTSQFFFRCGCLAPSSPNCLGLLIWFCLHH